MDSRLLAASTALNEGRKAEAIDLLTGFLSDDAHRAHPKAHGVLLNLLWEARRIDDGLRWSERAANALPRDPDIHILRGAFLRTSGQHASAIKAFDQAIRLRPADAAAQINKGFCYNDLGNGKAAEAIFSKLVRRDPRNPGLQRALARALTLQGKFAAAEAMMRQLLAANKQDIDAWLDLSAMASDRSNGEEALAVLDRALQAVPGDIRLLRAKIVQLRLLGRQREAIPLLTALLPHHGNMAWLLYELGIALIGTDLGQAINLLQRAIAIAPNVGDYRLALAECLLRQPGAAEGENVDEAYRTLAGLPLRLPLAAYDAKVRAEVLSQAADFAGVDAMGSFSDLGKIWATDGQGGALMPHLARVRTQEDRHALIDQHRLFGEALTARARRDPITRSATPRPGAKIRIGFMSSDLRTHPVSYFAWPLFEHVDRSRFEIYCYSWNEAAEPDATQQRITAMVDAFRWKPFIDSRDAAQLIADDDLDILFELGGMTHMSKIDVMAWKPASLCASWLGYPHSVGLASIDYLLVDRFLAPTDERLLIEKPLVMPHSWIAMSGLAFPDTLEIDPIVPVRRTGGITFGTANNPYKYNEAMLRIWAKVVARVPGSRFVIVRPEGGSKTFVRNILAQFAAEGVDAERVEFRPVRGDHMRHYNDIDIALDTFPQTGGTTTCDALWMGVPTVTMVGEALFERLSYSILSNAGLADLCATTPAQFVEIAVQLAADTDRLQDLRTGLRDRIRSGPLGRTKDFADNFYDLVARTVASHGIRDIPPIGGAASLHATSAQEPDTPSRIAAADFALVQGRRDEAVGLLLLAAAEQPAHLADIAPALIDNLLKLGRAKEALYWATEALNDRPDDPEIHNHAGLALSMLGRRDEAAEAFERVLALEPGHRIALVNKGQILAERGDLAEAQAIFLGLLAHDGSNAQLHRSLGKALWRQDKFVEAAASLRYALSIDPKHVGTWLDLSTLALDQGDVAGAFDILDEANRHLPNDEQLAEAKAVMFRRAGTTDQLGPYLDSIADRYSRSGWFQSELGEFVALRDRAAANEHFRKAVDLDPGRFERLRSLIANLIRIRGIDEGRHLDEAHRLLSAQPVEIQRKMSSVAAETLLLTADHERLRALGSIAELGREWVNDHYSALLYQLGRVESAGDRREILEQHRLWGRKVRARADRNPIKRSPSARRDGSKIRIGFMSSDLREHVVAYFVWPLLQHADRHRFEIYCYSFARSAAPSALQQRIAGMVDCFRWHPFITDRDAAEMIAGDDLDILFELGGSTQMNKLDVMAWKPARRSASWLGYPHSAGLETIDHLLVDPFLNPPDPKLMIEQPLIMPHSWIAMTEMAFPDRLPIDPVAPVRRNGFITFGTAGNPYKYNPPMLRAWARVMAGVPLSRFIFVRPEGGSKTFAGNIRTAFGAEGVSPDRIEFRAVRGDHMRHYNDIDIVLDTFPQTGGTTTCDALWMGVPTVTLVGEALFERLSYSILSNAGLADLCATTREQVVDIAIGLANDPERISQLRTGLRDRIRASALGQPEQFARDFYDLVDRTVRASPGPLPLSAPTA